MMRVYVLSASPIARAFSVQDGIVQTTNDAVLLVSRQHALRLGSSRRWLETKLQKCKVLAQQQSSSTRCSCIVSSLSIQRLYGNATIGNIDQSPAKE